MGVTEIEHVSPLHAIWDFPLSKTVVSENWAFRLGMIRRRRGDVSAFGHCVWFAGLPGQEKIGALTITVSLNEARV